jgi:SAM-dependent methyltransferase
LSEVTDGVTREEVEEFLATTEFTGYQPVPLPHGLSLPGRAAPGEGDAGARLDQIFRMPIEGRSFLDVGSYYGLFPYAAIERGASRAVGLEPADSRFPVASRIAELHGNRWEIRQMVVEDLPADETYDVITFLNVLHHVTDPIEAVRRLVRICNEALIVEFCLPDDPQMLVHLYDKRPSAGRANWWRARMRSLALRYAAGRLPLMAVGDWPVHRTFYFSPQAFENLFSVHLGWFDSIRFEPSATGLRRTVAYCHVAPDARERL